MMALQDQQVRKVLMAWTAQLAHRGQQDLPVLQVLVAGQQGPQVLRELTVLTVLPDRWVHKVLPVIMG